MSREIKEIILGTLLGDASLQTQNKGKTYRYKIVQSNQHKEYIFHLYRKLKIFCKAKPAFNEKRNIWEFQTLSSNIFNEWASIFYPNKVKVIPSNNILEEMFTIRTLAYWFMDDGSLTSKGRKSLTLHTQVFSEPDVIRICKFLENKYNIKCWVRKNKDKPIIIISGKSFDALEKILKPYIIDSMLYKFPTPRVMK